MADKRSLRRYLRQLLLLDELPERTARTFGLGVFISFSPLIGLHTLIAMVILLFVRLNRLSFLAGVFSNTPWTVAPMLALGTGLGAFVLGSDATLPELSSETLASGQFGSTLTDRCVEPPRALYARELDSLRSPGGHRLLDVEVVSASPSIPSERYGVAPSPPE